MPRVSVVIPSYNHEAFVAEAIRSALDQSYTDLEVVVTDDGSDDRTVDVVRRFVGPRVRVFTLEHRGAQFATRKCLAEAGGEYVAMLSSDDAFLPGKIEEQVRFLDEHPEVLAVFGFPKLVDESGAEILEDDRIAWFRQPNRDRFQWLRHFFFEGNHLCHPTILARRACYESVGPPDARLSLTSDYRRWIRTCLDHEIHVLQRELVRFRVRRGEANASGLRPAVQRRFDFELTKVLREYLDLRSPEDLLRVFPEAASLCREVRKELAPYLVAQMALRSEKLRPSSLVFAMDVLYEMLGDPATARLLEDDCGFRHRHFVELTGRYEPAPELRERLDRILRSRSWKLTEPLRMVMGALRRRPQKQAS